MKKTVDLKDIALKAEQNEIQRLLESNQFNKSKVATLLGIDRKTLYNKMKDYENRTYFISQNR